MPGRWLLACVLAMAHSPMALAQEFDDPSKAWTWEQGVRHAASKVFNAENPDPAQVREQIKNLEDLLVYLEDPRVKKLGEANSDLLWQRPDVLLDLSAGYAAAGDAGKAAARIDDARAFYEKEQANQLMQPYAVDRLLTFPAILAHKDDPAIRGAILRMRSGDPYDRFRSKALLTQGSGAMTVDERVAGLSLVWSEARYNFVHFDKVPGLDWDAAYLEYLPKVREAESTLDYYRVLQRFVALLKDSHSNVFLPDELAKERNARPPIRTTLAEGRVFISNLFHPKLEELGLRPGQEILKVDGEPVRAFAERTIMPYFGASTPQYGEVWAFIYELLKGPKDKPITLTVRGPGAAEADIVVPRAGYEDIKGDGPYDFRVLEGNIALVTLRGFDNDAGYDGFKKDFEKILACDALIFDVRLNGGGNSGVGWNILERLTDKPFRVSVWSTPVYRPAYRAWNRRPEALEMPKDDNLATPRPGPKFTKPVAVLIGPRTFSAAEDFAVAFDAMQRGPLVGEATGGSTGQPLFFRLPGGGSGRVCSKKDTYPDGKEFVGVGVQPTIRIAPTADDAANLRDPVLDAAVKAVMR